MVADSLEIRWFQKGSIPQNIKEWYLKINAQPIEKPARKDYYHYQLAGGTLGTKLREGMIEVKQLKGKGEMIALADGKLTGSLESWRKWSFKLAESGDYLQTVGSQDWLEIEKKRLLSRYAVENNKVIALGADEDATNGCEVELTEITFNKKIWWTICFEAFGQANMIKNNLLLVAEYITAKQEIDFNIDSNHSYSYAWWLQITLNCSRQFS